MRNLNKILGTGCFFLSLGGWVCDGQASRADSLKPSREGVLNAAVADATTLNPMPDTSGGNPASVEGGTSGQPEPAHPTEAAHPPATTKPADSSGNLSAPTVNVDVDGRVAQMNAQDLDINTCLHFLSLQSKRNIIASKDVKGTVTVNLYDVTFTEALDAILKPNGFDYIEKGNFIYVYTAEELAKIRARDHKSINHIFHLHYLTAQDAAILIKPLLSSAAVVALTPNAIAGLPTGVQDTGGMAYGTEDTLVINDFPENILEIEKNLKELDVRPKQVLIESTILNTSLSDNNALGVDIVSLSGIDFPNLVSVLGSTTSGSSGSTTSGSSTTGVTSPGSLAGGLVANGSTQTNVGTNFANSVPPGGLSIGFLSNNVSALVRALETVTNVTVVANPKILTLNKHHGEVLVGHKLGYLTTSTTQTTTDQTVSFMDVGTKLVFRPFICDDGYIRMEVHPEDSSGVLDSKGVPQTATAEVTTNVMIKDGRTVVIGGLFRESTSATRGQVPALGNIPIIGAAFRQTADDTERQEVIVLLTPHIINDDTALYDKSEKEAEDVHRMMLGNRADLQPWSRDRLSQLWYSKAQEQLEKGNKEKALMYVDWALNSNPEFIEAIKLREKLSNQKMEEAMQSSISEFAREVMKADAATTPDTGGAAHYPVKPAVPAAIPATMPATMPAK